MTPRLSVIPSFLAIALLATAAPLRAQAVHVELNGGLMDPTGQTNGNVNAGYHVGGGVSHLLAGTPLSLGVEASFVRFGEDHVEYAVEAMPTCPCTLPAPARVDYDTHLDLANYFATAKYAFGARTVRPYVAMAGGLTQQWGVTDYNGARQPSAFGLGGRAAAGVETHRNGLNLGLDVSYVEESGARYEGRFVRYVPVTLRLLF